MGFCWAGCGFADTGRDKNDYDVEFSYSWVTTPTITDTLRGRLFANRPCDDCLYPGASPPEFIQASLNVTPDSVSELQNGVVLNAAAEVTDATSCPFDNRIYLEFEDVTAVLGRDYDVERPWPSILIRSGTLSGSTTFSLNLRDDAIDTGERFFNVKGRSGGFNIPKDSVTILDNDVTARISLSPPELRVAEGNRTNQATITANLNAPASSPVSVNYITADETAKAGSDYTAHSGTLRFDIGDTSKTVTINITADSVFEREETFSLTINNPVNATITSNKSTIRILNDDIAPALSINPAEVNVTEGSSSYKEISLNISLDKPVAIAASVNYSTQNGTAKAGTDYISQNGTVRFSPGQQNKTIRINITGDCYAERNETFSIVLSNPVNALISRGTSTVTIIDDGCVDGVCGSSRNTCSSGAVGNPRDTLHIYRWTCLGSGGGANAPCEINRPRVDGVCGSSRNTCSSGRFADSA